MAERPGRVAAEHLLRRTGYDGTADDASDRALVRTGVHAHEANMHPGRPRTQLQGGGRPHDAFGPTDRGRYDQRPRRSDDGRGAKINILVHGGPSHPDVGAMGQPMGAPHPGAPPMPPGGPPMPPGAPMPGGMGVMPPGMGMPGMPGGMPLAPRPGAPLMPPGPGMRPMRDGGRARVDDRYGQGWIPGHGVEDTEAINRSRGNPVRESRLAGGGRLHDDDEVGSGRVRGITAGSGSGQGRIAKSHMRLPVYPDEGR